MAKAKPAPIVSFTGVHEGVTEGGRITIREAVQGLKANPCIFYSGCAHGADMIAAQAAVEYFPGSVHVLVVPQFKRSVADPVQQCRHDAAGVQSLVQLGHEQGTRVAVLASEAVVGTEATGFLRRNAMLALSCTHMLAFPRFASEEQRSGTWATVRRAQFNGVPVLVTPLDGSEPYQLREQPSLTAL